MTTFIFKALSTKLTFIYHSTKTSGGREAGDEGGQRPGWYCAGAAFRGAKIWNSEIWPLLANWRLHCRMEFALCNYYTPQLSILFVTVHTNAVVVTIRISTADLTGGGGNTDGCPGRQTLALPLTQTCHYGNIPLSLSL